MNCDIIRDLMPLYADGLASESSRRTIEEHAAGCPGCQKLLKEMCAPMEPNPEAREQEIMEKLYKKHRRTQVLSRAAVILALVLIVWGFLEIQFSGKLIYAASTNEEKILKEMPELALTDGELTLAQTIMDIPLIREALRDDAQDSANLDPEALAPYLSGIQPAEGQITDVFVMGQSIWINIIEGNRYTCLTYSDGDLTGHIDLITKTIAISSLDEIGPDGDLGRVKATYELIHAVGTNFEQYQKLKTRHHWFSFLNWN